MGRRKVFLFFLVLGLGLLLCLNAQAAVRELETALDTWFQQVFFTGEEIDTEAYSVTWQQTVMRDRVRLNKEYVTELSITADGDQAVTLDAVLEDGRWEIRRWAADLHCEPGEYVYHIRAASKNHTFEKDYTQKVIPLEEGLVRLRADRAFIEPGRDYSNEELWSLFLEPVAEMEGAFSEEPVFTCDSGDPSLTGSGIGGWFQNDDRDLDGKFVFSMGNVDIILKHVTVGPFPYRIKGPFTICGDSEGLRYEVEAVREGDQVPEDFVLTAEGAELSPDGRLTLRENTRAGDLIFLTASSEKTGMACRQTVEVIPHPVEKLDWLEVRVGNLTMELPADKGKLGGLGWTKTGPREEALGADIVLPDSVEHVLSGSVFGSIEGTANIISTDYDVSFLNRMPETAREAYGVMEETEERWTRNGYESIGRFYVNKFPAIWRRWTEEAPDCPYRHLECVFYAGTYQVNLDIRISVSDKTDVPLMGTEYLYNLIRRMKTEDTGALEISEQEQVPGLTQADGITETAGGAQVRYSAGDPDPFYGGVVWTVTDEHGEAVKAVSIDKNGTVKTSAGLKEAVRVLVRARYEYASAEAQRELAVYPAVKKLTVTADDSFLYLDGSHSLTVKAQQDPADAKLAGLAWSLNSEGIAELRDNGDGTATLFPLAVGTVNVAVSEAGGKKATAKFTVTDKPVTAVEITAKGSAAPGKTVTLSAKLTPDKPARKDVSWSVNVGGNVAEINAKGQLKIMKDTPAGTVITVTCTALGAPQPVAASLDITVE